MEVDAVEAIKTLTDVVAGVVLPGSCAALSISNDTKYPWRYCAHAVLPGSVTPIADDVSASDLAPGKAELTASYLGVLGGPLPAWCAVSYYFTVEDGTYRYIEVISAATLGVHAEIMYKPKDEMESILGSKDAYLLARMLTSQGKNTPVFSRSINASANHAKVNGAPYTITAEDGTTRTVTDSFDLTAAVSFAGLGDTTVSANVAVAQHVAS